MTNAELFKKIFGIYAEEFWAFPTEKMLDWIASDAPDIYVGKWTSYDEDMPKEDKPCLITAWGDTVMSAWPTDAGFEGDSYLVADWDVSAWMELPKPYEYPPKDFMNPPEGSEE